VAERVEALIEPSVLVLAREKAGSTNQTSRTRNGLRQRTFCSGASRHARHRKFRAADTPAANAVRLVGSAGQLWLRSDESKRREELAAECPRLSLGDRPAP
jgi:hypothetical protein